VGDHLIENVNFEKRTKIHTGENFKGESHIRGASFGNLIVFVEIDGVMSSSLWFIGGNQTQNETAFNMQKSVISREKHNCVVIHGDW
jgi:hypothetical protein